MKTIGIIVALGLATVGIASPAAAQVNGRQWNQQQRIQQGAASGRLSHREYNRLQNQQARIDRTEDRMRWRNGGRLNPSQRARLNYRQNRASANIYRQKHDWQHRRY